MIRRYLFEASAILVILFSFIFGSPIAAALSGAIAQIQDNGIVLVGSPYSILNCVDPGITCTDVAGVATFSFDSTEVGTTTWGSGAPIVWTFDASVGIDSTFTFGNNTITTSDDQLFRWGTGGDIAGVLVSAGLVANTPLAGVIIDSGALSSPLLSTDSFILSNTTSDGDILLSANSGGNSFPILYVNGATDSVYFGGKTAIPFDSTIKYFFRGTDVVAPFGGGHLLQRGATTQLAEFGIEFVETSAPYAGAIIALRGTAAINSANSQNLTGTIIGVRGEVGLQATGSPTYTRADAIQARVSGGVFGPPNVTNLAGVHILTPTRAGGTWNTFAGLEIEDPGATSTTNYSIWSKGGTSIFEGTGLFGVGYSIPQSKLEVSESTNGGAVTLAIANRYNAAASTDETVELSFQHWVGSAAPVYASPFAGKIVSGKEDDYGVGARADSFMSFYTAINRVDTERLRITSGGKVGIGTTIPNELLDVASSTAHAWIGTSSATLPDGNTNPRLMIGSATGSNPGILTLVSKDTVSGNSLGVLSFANYNTAAADKRVSSLAGSLDTDSTSGNLTFTTWKTGTASEKMRITRDGNIGIGVTVPTAKLHLKAGTITAGTAPLKFNTGPLLTISEAGAVEFLTDNLYFTQTTSAVRNAVAFWTKGTKTLGVGAATFSVLNNSILVLTGDAGTNNVTTITGGIAGQHVTLQFVDALVTITDDATHAANTTDLAGNFVSTASDTLTLEFDGTSWYEMARSVN